MGQIITSQIASLFGGVSRQPQTKRNTEQVQNQKNALSSVVTGGFEKRPCTQHIAALTALDANKEYSILQINRSSTDQVFVLLTAGDVFVYDAITGAAKTVAYGDTTRYFEIETDTLNGTGVTPNGEKQLKIDSTETAFFWEWELSDATTGRFKIEGSADGVIWNDLQTGIGGAASGNFSTTIGAVATNDHNYIRVNITTGMATAADTLTLKATFKDKTYLFEGITGPEDFSAIAVNNHTLIANRTVTTKMAAASSGTVTNVARDTVAGTPPAGIPAPSGTGNIYKIVQDGNDFTSFYVIDDTVDSVYKETVDPNAHNEIAAYTMPHQLVRSSDGSTYTFSAASWSDRAVGDEEIVPEPAFIGNSINDVVFFRDRLTLISSNGTFSGEAFDTFDLWPAKAVEVLDTDPVDRRADVNEINILRYAAPLRKLMFVTSDRTQFELGTSTAFTPTSALFDQTTKYPASPIAKPQAMGDVLYFGSSGQDHSTVYEYFFDESSLSNTAVDVTEHVTEFIGNDIIQIAADSESNTLFLLSSAAQNKVFVYRTFFDGSKKIMSSWSEYIFGDSEATAFIHGMAVFDGFLVLVIERFDGVIYLEQMQIDRESPNATINYIPLIDQREILTGTYVSAHDATYWDPTWEHQDDAEVVLGPNFTGGNAGRRLSVATPDQYTLTLASVAAGEVITIDDGTTSQDYTAHATTTTTANREFSISGNDIADAGELVTCINDATDGHPSISATDNGDGTITLNVDDPVDGTIVAPTGTAITNATITATAFGKRVSARGDWSAQQAYVGRKYTMTVELSKLFAYDQNQNAILEGRSQVRDMTFTHQDSGYYKVRVTPLQRTANDYEFTGAVIGSASLQVGVPNIEDDGRFMARVNSDGRTAKIEVINDTPFPSVITSASWRAFFNERGRQG